MTIRARDLQRLVDRFGQPLTLVSRGFGAYDPATGTKPVTEVNTGFTGYFGSYDIQEIDGVNVIRGDRKLILGSTDAEGLPISPEVDDQVDGDGDTVSIVSVGKIMSNGVVVCYICQCRK